MATKRFEVGARVAWSGKVAPLHGQRSVLLKEAVTAAHEGAEFGTVTGHDPVGWPIVKLDSDGREQILTNDELVAIEEAE